LSNSRFRTGATIFFYWRAAPFFSDSRKARAGSIPTEMGARTHTHHRWLDTDARTRDAALLFDTARSILRRTDEMKWAFERRSWPSSNRGTVSRADGGDTSRVFGSSYVSRLLLSRCVATAEWERAQRSGWGFTGTHNMSRGNTSRTLQAARAWLCGEWWWRLGLIISLVARVRARAWCLLFVASLRSSTARAMTAEGKGVLRVFVALHRTAGAAARTGDARGIAGCGTVNTKREEAKRRCNQRVREW
jgi:hypothetical protein